MNFYEILSERQCFFNSETYEEAEKEIGHFFEHSDYGAVGNHASGMSEDERRSNSPSPERVPQKFELILPVFPPVLPTENDRRSSVNLPCETPKRIDKSLRAKTLAAAHIVSESNEEIAG